MDDVESLCLTFELPYDDADGNKQTMELVKDGKDMDVTNSNKLDYVQ